ncbi:MAG: radical SAM protein [bacterium]|nr:radical SAM protein [bacterium]
MPFRELNKNDQGLVGIGIDITERCNRKCPTCFVSHTPKDMKVSIFKRIVDEGVRLGFKELYILGGEPTIHPKIIEFLEYSRGKFSTIILVTNMDKLSNIDFCKQISDLDVVIAGQRHVLNENGGAENIERILTGGEHLTTSHRAWMNVEKTFPSERICVQCCITKPVVESGSIFKVFRWARKRGYEPVMEFTKEGTGFKRGCSLDISSEEMLSVLEKLQKIDKEEFGILTDLLSPQAYGKTCHMLETSIHFLVDGSAIPCVGHHNLNYGNIKGGLDMILQYPLRQFMKNPHEWIYGYCRDECQYFDRCTGGCRGSAFDMSGCPRASFYYCPHIPRDSLSLQDMIPPSCLGCPLENNNVCNPMR